MVGDDRWAVARLCFSAWANRAAKERATASKGKFAREYMSSIPETVVQVAARVQIDMCLVLGVLTYVTRLISVGVVLIVYYY